MYVGRVESRVTGKAKNTIFSILKSSFLELGRPFKVRRNHIENIGNSIFHVQYGFTYRIQYHFSCAICKLHQDNQGISL